MYTQIWFTSSLIVDFWEFVQCLNVVSVEESMLFTNFADLQPDGTADELCLVMSTLDNFGWDDRTCSSYSNVLCEIGSIQMSVFY